MPVDFGILTRRLLNIVSYAIQTTRQLLDSNNFKPVLTGNSFKTGIWQQKDDPAVTSRSCPRQDDPNYASEKS